MEKKQRSFRTNNGFAENDAQRQSDAMAGSEGDDTDSGLSHSDDDVSWISWFCSLKGNEFYVEVEDNYIRDGFNLTGLTSQVPYYDYALDLILDADSPSDDMLTEEQQEMIESAAEMLYGLIHARFILTNRGMQAMKEKYYSAEFGRCPRVFCYGFPVLPVGQSDVPCTNTVKVFCSKCEDIFYPKSSRHGTIDGAYFGTTFPHLFLQTYSELRGVEPTQKYVPRIFGFKIHKSAETSQEGNTAPSAATGDGRATGKRSSSSKSAKGSASTKVANGPADVR